MFTKVKRFSVVAIILTISLLNVAFSAQMKPCANNVFKVHDATLVTTSNHLKLRISVETFQPKSRLGVSEYTLYDQTTGKNTFYGAKSYSSGSQYGKYFDIVDVVKGHTYYVKVTFYADGSTYSQVTNSVRIQ